MAFRIRDLVVDVWPVGPDVCGITNACPVVSVCPEVPGSVVAGGDCGNGTTCRGCTNTCDGGCSRIQCSDFPEPSRGRFAEVEALQLAELQLLQAELQVAIRRLDALQKPQIVTVEPTTADEMDILESRLQEAIEDVRERRARLPRDND